MEVTRWNFDEGLERLREALRPVRDLERLFAKVARPTATPRDLAAVRDSLEALPGVGHETASVVMVQAFGEPAFPVDTHIHRLAGRWGLSRARNVVEVERDLKKLFAPEDWGKVHLQIIYFGREHCPARGHDLSSCPICGWAASKARMRREARR